jgi:hypothetical protein
MRAKNGTRAATAAHLHGPGVAPRFTRAAQAERSRLESRREQLLGKREAVQAEVGRIDGEVAAVDQLLELLAPLLVANGSEPEAAGENGTPGVERGASASESGEAPARDHAQH